MSIASEPKHCPKCQAPLPGDAPQGLCPKCLLAAAAIPTEAGQPAPDKPPPGLAELAAAFPQLEILELIGQGGMGFVFKARQPKLDRFVALKILPQSLAADPAFAERFSREGRVLAKLNHPNIVTIHDFGQASGFFYLLMEFVDGVNLRQAMRAGRFTPDQALAIVPKICEALQFAHNEGILHRDIKPENILLDAKGRVKIADFGIAKLMERGSVTRSMPETSTASGSVEDSLAGETAAGHRPALHALTEAGKALGTPNYMAPEQREYSGEVDQRADIYSLGVVFYEMLTGELPLGRFAPPSEKSAADPRVDEVVLRALAKEKANRYASADEVKTQVETIAATPDSGRRRGDESQTEKPSADKDKSQSLLRAAWLRGILWVMFALCLLNFICPRITPELGSPNPAIEIGLTKPWLVLRPQHMNGSQYIRMFAGPFRSSAFISGIVAMITGLILFIGRRKRVLPNVTASRTPREVEQRFSRTAIWGAYWTGISIFALLFLIQPLLGVPPGSSSAALAKLIILLCLIPGFTAPFGTTILGWIAVSQIRRSAGKLHGLWLAVFDGLFFPLLALDGLIVGGVLLGGVSILASTSAYRSQPWAAYVWLIFPAGLVALVCDYLIIRRVWRAVNKPVGDVPLTENAQVTPSRRGNRVALALAFGSLFLGVLGMTLLSDYWKRHDSAGRPDNIAASDVSFGPVVERIITVGNDARSFYSFDRGDYVSGPTDFDPTDHDRNYADLWKWLTQNHVDIFARQRDGRPVLVRSEMVTADLNEDDFDRLTPAQMGVNTVLESQNRPQETSTLSRGRLRGSKDTFAFQNRFDVRGVLQVVGVTSDPPGVKIRYKLVQDAATAQPAATPAGNADFVVFHPAGQSTAALGAARDFVIAQKWQLKGEGGGNEGVTIEAADPGGKRVTFNETPQAGDTSRFTVSAEEGAEMSATRIGAQLWHQLGWGNFKAAAAQKPSIGPVMERELTDADLTLAEQPPVVVETFPVAGARDVPSGETEIRVRFSKPMADGSWSWSTAWEGSLPAFIGQPHYEADGKTCVLKVKLEAGRTYGFWLNSEKFKKFADRAGQPAVPYLLIFQTKQQQ